MFLNMFKQHWKTTRLVPIIQVFFAIIEKISSSYFNFWSRKSIISSISASLLNGRLINFIIFGINTFYHHSVFSFSHIYDGGAYTSTVGIRWLCTMSGKLDSGISVDKHLLCTRRLLSNLSSGHLKRLWTTSWRSIITHVEMCILTHTL